LKKKEVWQGRTAAEKRSGSKPQPDAQRVCKRRASDL
jgi:hypothetical protein